MIRELQGSAPAGNPDGAGVWRVWMSDLLAAESGLIHAMTLSDRNLSLTSGGDAAAAVEQRRELCGALGVPFEQLTVAQQVHGCEVVPVNDALAGSGRADHGEAIGYVDGLYTQAVRRPLLSLSADCPRCWFSIRTLRRWAWRTRAGGGRSPGSPDGLWRRCGEHRHAAGALAGGDCALGWSVLL